MVVASAVGVLDGVPEGDGIGVVGGVALASRGGVPEVGVPLGVDGDGHAEGRGAGGALGSRLRLRYNDLT